MDRLKAEMKNLDIFGVEQLRDDLEKHIGTSQKPKETIGHDDCLPSASNMVSDSACRRGQSPGSNLAKSRKPYQLAIGDCTGTGGRETGRK
ncbi:hypothetical protein XPA_009290 [Xanthoria parietina]